MTTLIAHLAETYNLPSSICAEDLVLGERTGLVFPRGDGAALTRCLAALCAGAAGQARRQQLAAGALAQAACWTYVEATAGLLQALDSLVRP